MPRTFNINGETMVSVKGPSDSAIPLLTQLGLSDDQISVTIHHEDDPVMVNAYGGGRTPTDYQKYLTHADVRMTLVHYDNVVLDECMRLSIGGGAAFGSMPRTGVLMGGNQARFVPGNFYIGLNIASPVEGRPWRFLFSFLSEPPMVLPLGTKRSIVQLNWRAIAYTNDPWGGAQAGQTPAQPGTAPGTGSLGALLFDRNVDT